MIMLYSLNGLGETIYLFRLFRFEGLQVIYSSQFSISRCAQIIFSHGIVSHTLSMLTHTHKDGLLLEPAEVALHKYNAL